MNLLMLLADLKTWQDNFELEHSVPRNLQRGRTSNSPLTARLAVSSVELLESPPAGIAADTASLPCVGSQPLLVWASEKNIWADAGRGAVKVCPASYAPIDQIVQALRGRLAKVDRWHLRLREQALYGTASFDGLLSVGRELVDRSLVLFDGSFNYLGYAGDDLPRSIALEKTIREGYAMGVSAAHQREYRHLLAEHPEGFQTDFEENGKLTPQWTVSFETHAGMRYHLHVMGAPEGAEGLHAVVDDLVGDLRAMAERIETDPRRKPATDYVQELVSKTHAEEEARRRARVFGWETGSHCLVARIANASESFPTERWRHVASCLEAALPLAHTSVMDDGITVLAFEEPGRNTMEQPLVSLRSALPFLSAHGLSMGISDPSSELGDLPSFYEEAMVAACIAMKRGETALEYDACKLELLVGALQSEASRHDVVPRPLAKMLAYDTANETSYVQTARALVAARGCKARTCRNLAIHRSTLEYRIERIRTLFGLDFEDDRTLELAALVFATGFGEA